MKAHILRINVARWRVVQAMGPLAVIAGVLYRRVQHPITVATAVVVLVVAIVAFGMSRRSFGWRELRVGRRGIAFGEGLPEIRAADVHNWSRVEGTVRLYGPVTSWRLKIAPTDRPEIESILSGVFGPSVTLRRRGSWAARKTALAVAIAGVAATAVGIAWDLLPAALVGTPCAIFGGAVFGALSQRVQDSRR